jgi:hypothetical protein
VAGVYLSSYSGTGATVAVTGKLQAKNGLTLGSVTAEPEAGVIILPATGGTSSTYVANAPSGTVKFFEHGGELYIKNSSGGVYKINLTAV